ncbi:ubiquitin carboxyl-terminal hydrolase 1 isoform 1 [Mus musculus]|uniref:Ubiquitin carboxyl-terminal hydrolase 1 n=1 Tax=Mus musculus TaxID=10090 RepID=UBP1_MOUSE|nr:ubiquitin carboxyl-terminal hydrolase 1 isoform 1 [Mus musculus]NP_666256.2 ubiquitin carboxyl-terminal hydrolase 1 isoform 1 [Mus musculus]Q8BJQ2.1 RecName: Full=Ubiquitin carboxyl-terminal hydrolase 1; AltName: Full=Deubiquitinating enzyme 1; AltName: Full=Ubiquitin thioesterase 1; AltName: Full=Ubiquitin-specific-processing protease 1; Contains: RecName: Full=Ubiquitin carboxyl-terminal hydrolase 1, N-terminal fragment [Mus musculus]EDL30895.1 ubiquitin specific peptidase 1, isoform CRA_a |eukprot:NP_001288343.1 ubiquitin carboxyl-terminal hydrolase 1 isoform 1 [Mus musculus]
MPGVIPSESNGLSRGSPSKKNRLSLKFFQKKETKRALDFTDSQENEEKTSEYRGSEIDQVVPAAQSSPVSCEKRENLLPFVGLNNLGNTCYLNSILQVLYFCPGFKTGVKHLFNIISRKKEALKDDSNQKDKGSCKEESLASYELICSLQSLIISVEQLQASFLLNPEKYTDELATQPRRLLNTLRELNPMYEGFLQHDAQEVLQCILGNIQETCQLLKKEEIKNLAELSGKVEEQSLQKEETGGITSTEIDSMRNTEDVKEQLPKGNWKRKSDSESSNVKKKVKLSRESQPLEENQRQTRSKRKAIGDTLEAAPKIIPKCVSESESAKPSQKKSKVKINWLKPSTKQPSILSKFCSLGKITTNQRSKGQPKEKEGDVEEDLEKYGSDHTANGGPESPGSSVTPVDSSEAKSGNKGAEQIGFELVEKLFQGQLVLRTRCLECESLTERREDFQDISVPVQEDELSKVEESSEISPEPKTEMKTLRWAISQFASVERIVGEDKYFCENCHHYTEAERSLLFDKMPEVITIHLKCFAASGLEFDCYGGGLSKINTPLLTPLKLSLEEWSTKPTNDSYGLFAVVMHSGITISSGHYTASVKVTDLNSLELDEGNFVVDQMCELGKPEPLTEEQARGTAGNYDDEVSIRVGGNAQPSKVLNKKNVEGIGLLGGQKSKADYELYNKASNPDKVVGTPFTDNRNSETNDTTNGTHESDRNKESSDQTGVNMNGLENKISYVVQSLKEYEGKWLLFDDSEVKVTEEKDFLNSLSPSTSPTSTPYLLFYKKL